MPQLAVFPIFSEIAFERGTPPVMEPELKTETKRVHAMTLDKRTIDKKKMKIAEKTGR